MKKYVLLTGATSNVGKAIAFEFGSKGHNLILVDNKRDLLESVKRDIENTHNIKIIVEDAVLSKVENIDKLYNNVRHYEIEALINNNNVSNFEKITEVDLDVAYEIINQNVVGMTNLTLKYIKDYVDKIGTIVNISSIHGYFISKIGSVFTGTQFYTSSFSEGVARQLKNHKSELSIKVFATTNGESNNNTENVVKPISFEEIATNIYKLYKSDKTVAIVDLEKNKFNFLNNIFVS